MRKLLQGITDRLRSFILQRDDFALVVSCSATDGLLVLKNLEGLADASTSEMFWTSVDDFKTPVEYAQVVVNSFIVKHQAVRLSLAKEGKKPWPVLPVPVASKQTPPAERLRALLAFSRSLLPVVEGGLVVWVLFPGEVADQAEFANLIRDLLKHDFPFPWCHHIRIIIREDPAERPLTKLLKDAPRVQWCEVELSLPKMEKAMEEEINDESLPLEQRMNTLLVMAGVDSAYKRYPDALEKYELLAKYHGTKGNFPLVALAINGMGEVHQRQGELDKAGQYYEAALEPASASLVPSPVLFNVVVNLATLRAEQGRWAEAETYHDSAEKLAFMCRNVGGKLQAVEGRGVAQYQQQKVSEAVVTWEQGVEMAEKLGEDGFRRSMLGRLEAHYQRTNQKSKLDEVRRRRATQVPAGSSGADSLRSEG